MTRNPLRGPDLRARLLQLQVTAGGDHEVKAILGDAMTAIELAEQPVPMVLYCPMCHARHLDVGEFATKVHHTHACQHCGLVWRPALVATVGVQYLPGFHNEEPAK